MTNIRTEGMWPEKSSLPDYHRGPVSESITDLFVRRAKTYKGFAQIEEEKGLLRTHMSLSTPEGQEAVRILVQRGLEEMAEAYVSDNRDHYLEELIDAINYFWILAILDPKSPRERIIQTIINFMWKWRDRPLSDDRINNYDIGYTVTSLMPVFEKLRHRAWMNTVQDPYFSGWTEIAHFISDNLWIIYTQFSSWTEFVQFFIAKDNVLQFRLATKY